MVLALMVFGCLSGLELALWLPPFWKLRKAAGISLLAALGIVSAGLVIAEPQVWTGVLAILSLYRMVNLLRLVKGRIQPDYLYNAALRTSLWLMGLQGIDIGLAALSHHYQVSALAWLYALAAVQLLAALTLL